MRVIVLTSDVSMFLMKGFILQWMKYKFPIANPVLVAGFTPPDFPIPLPYFEFVSLGDFKDYPINKWSDGLIKLLTSITDPLVLLMLEDFWLMREVNARAIRIAHSLMLDDNNIARFCLSSDRLYEKSSFDVKSIGDIDIIESPNGIEYRFSTQASLWRRSSLLELLLPGETPWEAEILGNTRLNQTDWRVLGTRQWPMRYMIMVNKGQFDRTGQWMYPPRTLSTQDWDDLKSNGCLPEGV